MVTGPCKKQYTYERLAEIHMAIRQNWGCRVILWWLHHVSVQIVSLCCACCKARCSQCRIQNSFAICRVWKPIAYSL